MWKEKNKQLHRKFEFKDFKQAFEFMQSVAEAAEDQQHHPKWQNEYNKVEIWLTTHDAGKITDKDKKLAQAIDKIYKHMTAKKAPKDIDLQEAKLYTDGGSRGNPGPSAGAFVICNMDDNVVEKTGVYLGLTTNNQAEYKGLKAGLERCKELSISKVDVYLDSELVVKQMNGLYKVKNPDLAPIYQQSKKLAENFGSIKFIHVPRALNKDADEEVNRILDEQASKS